MNRSLARGSLSGVNYKVRRSVKIESFQTSTSSGNPQPRLLRLGPLNADISFFSLTRRRAAPIVPVTCASSRMLTLTLQARRRSQGWRLGAFLAQARNNGCREKITLRDEIANRSGQGRTDFQRFKA